MRKVSSIIGLICILCSVLTFSQKAAFAGEVQYAEFGCKNKEYAEKMLLAKHLHGEMELYRVMVNAGLQSGDCRFFVPGDKISIEVKGLFDLSCIRSSNEIDCYWSLPSMTK